MVASPPDYQILKNFIDMMFGILFILIILKFTLLCLKYVLTPVKLFFQGIMYVLNHASEKSKKFVNEYEDNINKKNKVKKPNIKVVKQNTTDECSTQSSDNGDCKVIDFSKIRRK